MRSRLLLMMGSVLLAGSVAALSACETGPSPTLTVEVSGSGSVVVGGSPPCTATPGHACRSERSDGEVAHLQAVPDTGFVFSGWSGDGPSGAALETDVTVWGQTYVLATFASEVRTLTVTVVGEGVVWGGGLSCREAPTGVCAITPPLGSSIVITATPSEHWTFVGWSFPPGGIENPLTLLMDSDRALTATFTPGGTADYSGQYNFTLTEQANDCEVGRTVPLRWFVDVGMAAAPTFTFHPATETPPLGPVTFEATTWDPATAHAVGESEMNTRDCPTLGYPPCEICFRLALDVTFSSEPELAFQGNLVIEEQPLAGGLPPCDTLPPCAASYVIDAELK